MPEPIPTPYSTAGFLRRKLLRPSVLVLLGIVVYTLFSYNKWIAWNPDKYYPFHNDVDQYYSYLPAQFIHQDLNFRFENSYWFVTAPNGKKVPKVTMGMAYMYLPFFVIANNIAYQHHYDGLGYSPPFAWCIHFGSIFYILLGLWYTRKTLLLFFNEWVTACALALVLFGTNLFYYTYVESEMAHGYLFFLFAVFLYHVLQWHKNYRTKHLLIFSFVAGLATLIRPTEILILLFPLLLNVTSRETLKARFQLILGLRFQLLWAALLFMLPIIPQLLFWKMQTGQFLFFSYGSEEGFFFTDPKFYSVLLGYRKGWLMYTPLMIVALVGLVWMFFRWRTMFVPLCCYFLLNLYLIASWWDWGYGGGLGMRALVHTYAFLVLPLAFVINKVFSLKLKFWLKSLSVGAFLALCFFFADVSLTYTFLKKNSIIHWDSMSKKAYWYTFLKLDYNDQDRTYLESVFVHPDYEAMRKGKRDE